MIRKPSDTQALGLDLEKRVLKTAHLETLRGKVKITRLEAYTLADNHAFSSAKEEHLCHEQCDRFLTIGAIEGAQVLIRKLKINLTKPKDVDAAFPFEAEGQLPFAIDEGYLDKIVVDKQTDATWLTMLAAKKSAVAKTIESFNALKIEPEILTTTPHALAAFEGIYGAEEQEVLVIYLGESQSLIALVNQGKLISSHSLAIGVDTLEKAYLEDQVREPEILEKSFQDFDFSDDLELSPTLKEAVNKYKREINWMVLSELKGVKSAYPIMVLGEGATLKGFETLLFNELELRSIDIKASEGMEMNQNLLKRFAIAIGSALTALPHYPYPINFRQQEAEYPFPWKRFKGTLALFIGSSIALAAMIFLFGQAYMGYKEDLIKQTYSEVLAENGKRFKDFEQKVNPVDPVVSLKDLSASDLRERLNALQSEINSEPDLFPLSPQVPLVSDTLAWLSNLPEMKGPDGTIQIESFNYTLVKRPDQTKKNEKYQVKVDLELIAPTPKMARELHTALIQPNEFIDPKAEVKWSASKNKYRTSFFLKDKTTYFSGNK
jgi:type IV pilus assembly protein PilM